MTSRVFLFLGCAGCGSTINPATLPAVRFNNTLVIPASVGSDQHRVVIDSAAPWWALDPLAFPSLVRAEAVTPLPPAHIGASIIRQDQYQSIPVCHSNCSALPGGAMPTRAFAPHLVTLDYRHGLVTIGALTPSADVAPPVVVPVRVLGGFSGTPRVAPSRMVAHIDIEGLGLDALVDTGASVTTIRGTLFDMLTADGRAVIETQSHPGGGSPVGRIARCRSLRAGDAMLRDVAIEAMPAGGDAIMNGLSQETGVQIDAALGGSFLRDFVVSLDYAEQSLVLRRYTAADPEQDEFQRVGVTLRPIDDGTTYRIERLLGRSDASFDQVATAPGFVGGLLESVDGAPLAGLPFERADRLLRGAIGAAKTLVVTTIDGRKLTTTLHVAQTLPPPRLAASWPNSASRAMLTRP